ncbi:MAG: hypothetical protein CLLPBCKN_003174 [Chroococcidiopsis cubana SAG 39.79]|jgi:hypothetical protein|uniref:DUF4278 domain-containing protein n=1 Tax=Chroococcidiopsis cubana SAG 39.79 TaxID=388085 RepID=A0AB37UQ29_9CYAN|nr:MULTISPECIES: DUF4278 domain-containing protein [Chroococcidiopsis]PSB41935.1 hypothetical protein C7B80_29125 [Cyanosarcina cf. burmensis CCALA 770]MDZ4873778.1 hypothetical protein [Chroococcidiopsis cubana SAG 39.79]PSB60415.1 hypothetical protein C7B79_25785 [Chroococcidiopsis cubana CCALA 043]RUT13548.1 hypothetical protein DSM107010_11710 [Chroococcidiopsis cubana SAG 39.79]URD51398.1 DUF4278 domain-containing protein [Chroococcidiopsis sp. CCNUC1]
MQLSYRGLAYTKSNQSAQVVTKQVAGKYRGVSFGSRPTTQAIAPQPTQQLKYRGLAY